MEFIMHYNNYDFLKKKVRCIRYSYVLRSDTKRKPRGAARPFRKSTYCCDGCTQYRDTIILC